jgi:hypothetical protein
MAADKALIAGAAKVAGAKAKLDNATLDAFTDLGDDVMKGAESILADIQAQEKARTEEYENDKNDINAGGVVIPDSLKGTKFFGAEGMGMIEDPSNLATQALNNNPQNFDYNEAIKDGKIQESFMDANKYISVTSSELKKLNADREAFNEDFKISPLVDTNDEKYQMFMAHVKDKAEWGSFVTGPAKKIGRKTIDSFGYKAVINGKEVVYTPAQMDEARKYYFQKDDTGDVTDFIEDSTKRRFKTATNNAQANAIFEDEKKKLLANKENLEKLVVNTSGLSMQTLKNKYGEEYDNFLERQGEQYLQEQQALHYTPPKVDEPKEDPYKNAKEFIASLTLPTGVGMRPISNKAYFSSAQFQSDAQTAGIIFEPEMKIEGTGDDAKEVPTGNFLAAHMSNSASKQTPVRINPNEPLEAIQGKLEAIYLY